MRCYICNYSTFDNEQAAANNFTKDDKGRDVCSLCVKESRKYWNYQGKEGVHDCSSNVEAQVEELVKRIPSLMSGPSCPNHIPFNCKCTYKTGCKFYVDNPSG